MVVVDTNILAYLLIQGDRTQLAQALLDRDADWCSEAFIFIEFSNILATYLHRGSLDLIRAERLLEDAQRIVGKTVTVPHLGALQVADELGISACDARFVAAAGSLGAILVTEDLKLLTAAPKLTISLSGSLQSA